MTIKLGLYRYWGDRKPDTKTPLLTFTRPNDALVAKSTVATAGASGVSAKTGTLRIYGPIDEYGGWWGVSSKEVATALDLLGDVDQIVVRINSPGGDSFEGRAIMNLLRAHPAQCVAVVDGLAASAASYIAVGCDETVMAPGTMMMIHDTHTIIYGAAADLRKQADVIDQISLAGAELYANVAGGSVEQWRDLQRAETWFTAAEAVAAKLADRVDIVADSGPVETTGQDDDEDDDPIVTLDPGSDDRSEADYDLSIFAFSGRDQAPDPQLPTASAGGETHTEGGSAVAFSDEQMTTLRQKLGVAETADEATIVAALDEALNERAETDSQGRIELPEGVVTIDATQLEEMRSAAELGREAHARQEREGRERAVDQAIEDGRISPARRDAWLSRIEADPAEAETLSSLEKGLVPVNELGTAQGLSEDQNINPISDDEATALAAMTGLPKEAFRG